MAGKLEMYNLKLEKNVRTDRKFEKKACVKAGKCLEFWYLKVQKEGGKN